MRSQLKVVQSPTKSGVIRPRKNFGSPVAPVADSLRNRVFPFQLIAGYRPVVPSSTLPLNAALVFPFQLIAVFVAPFQLIA